MNQVHPQRACSGHSELVANINISNLGQESTFVPLTPPDWSLPYPSRFGFALPLQERKSVSRQQWPQRELGFQFAAALSHQASWAL